MINRQGRCCGVTLNANERLEAIDAIMEKARKGVKNYLRCGMSTDLRDRLSLDDVKAIAALAKVKGRK